MSLAGFLYGQRPTECPICGAPHSACTTFGHDASKGVMVRQLPARDAANPPQDVTRRALTAIPPPPPTAGPGSPDGAESSNRHARRRR